MSSAFRISEGSQPTVPHVLTKEATLANWLMGTLGKSADQKIGEDMGRLLNANPKEFARKYLADLPPNKALVVVEQIRQKIKGNVSPAQLYPSFTGEDQ
jgi:hypothetical protein